MKKIEVSQLKKIKGGQDDAGCVLYLMETGFVAIIGGMAFGPVGAGLAVGFLVSVPNPCKF